MPPPARPGASSFNAATGRRGPWTSGFRPAWPTARACAWRAKANPARSGAPAGDLFLRVRLAPHSVFERKGQDLYVNVPVPVTTAVLGGQVNVPTLAGPPARLQGAAADAERTGVPAAGLRDAVGGSRREGATSSRAWTSSCLARCRPRRGSTTPRWRSWATRGRGQDARRKVDNDMSTNKLTEKAQEAIVAAQSLAGDNTHAEMTPEHLLVDAGRAVRAASCRRCSAS